MDVQPVAAIAGALLFTPAPHADERGFFCRTFDAEITRAAGIDPAFAQDSLSRSAAGVIRGMHLRSGAGEAKLVRCSFGVVFDVIVDLRPGSPTFRNQASVRAARRHPGVAVRARRVRARIPGPAPTRPTCPTASTGRTTRARTWPSRSTTRTWPSRGRARPRWCRPGTGPRAPWPPRWRYWPDG